MASQGNQRPRRIPSPSSSTKPQPMRATMPFSLSTKRNSSPPRGSYLRRPSPTSSPVLNEGSIKATRRSSPETRTSPENRRSPTSPLLFVGSKAERPKSASTAIRRTSSLDTLSGSYLSSQWPRDISVSTPAAMVSKETQTSWDDHANSGEQPKHQRSASWGSADNLQELYEIKFRQYRQRTKQNSQLYGRQSPVAGDHSAVPHLGASSSIPIPVVPKTVLHARCSMEGLNSEIQGLVVTDGDDSVFRSAYEERPDGRRAPFPRVSHGSISAITHATGDLFDSHENSSMVSSSCQTRSSPSTPSGESKPHSSHSEPGGRDSSSPDVPSGLKYASSPKPNKSYLFGREPPDGAEKVLLHMDEKTEECQLCVSGPDKSKGTIKFSKQSPFHSILPSKVAPPSDNSCVH